jgi:hypothetical protein
MTNAEFTSIGKVVVAILERGGEIRDRKRLIKLLKEVGKYEVWKADSVNGIYTDYSVHSDITLALKDFIELAEYQT